MASAVNVSATNNAEIDGLLSGYKWSGTITYSFPDAASDYSSPYSGGSSEPTTSGFAAAPSQMQAAINYAIGLILGYTNANIQYAGTNGADIMVAQSPAANPTSYAYYPGNYAASAATCGSEAPTTIRWLRSAITISRRRCTSSDTPLA
ncbi:hypothetical protein [Bradyrhizobium sp. LM2.3]